jgi:hypothetical protein
MLFRCWLRLLCLLAKEGARSGLGCLVYPVAEDMISGSASDSAYNRITIDSRLRVEADGLPTEARGPKQGEGVGRLDYERQARFFIRVSRLRSLARRKSAATRVVVPVQSETDSRGQICQVDGRSPGRKRIQVRGVRRKTG